MIVDKTKIYKWLERLSSLLRRQSWQDTTRARIQHKVRRDPDLRSVVMADEQNCSQEKKMISD